MQEVALYDPNRKPAGWRGVILPSQYAVFLSDVETETELTSDGSYLGPGMPSSCLIFDSLEETERYCRSWEAARLCRRGTSQWNELAQRPLGWRTDEHARGLVELVILNVGLDLGVISPTVFSMMVIMALVTTFIDDADIGFVDVRKARTDSMLTSCWKIKLIIPFAQFIFMM